MPFKMINPCPPSASLILIKLPQTMSKLSFKLFCIEKYADKKNIKSHEVFSLFEKNGILQMLDQDYELLHGHGFEYMINDIDEILERRK
jgi:hypothetical protein